MGCRFCVRRFYFRLADDTPRHWPWSPSFRILFHRVYWPVNEKQMEFHIKNYFIDQRNFLADPRSFVDRVRPQLVVSIRQPVIYLLGAGAGILAVGQVNLNLYGERITRAISLPDVVSGQASALASAGLLAVGIYAALKIVGARVTLRESAGCIFYAIAFVLPLITAIFIAATRIASFFAGVTILFLPPTKILAMGVPETTWIGAFAMALVVTVEVGWNLY